MSSYRPDAGIPVLTEVIELSDAEDGAGDAPAAADPGTTGEAAAPTQAATVPAAELLLRSEADLRRIEQEISERVLQQLLGRVDFVLEQRVRDNLADVLQTAVDRLADEIRQGLRVTLADIVTRAVTQELSRLQSKK